MRVKQILGKVQSELLFSVQAEMLFYVLGWDGRMRKVEGWWRVACLDL